MINPAPRAASVTVPGRMCTTSAPETAAGTAGATSVKSPEARRRPVSWRPRATPRARHRCRLERSRRGPCCPDRFPAWRRATRRGAGPLAGWQRRSGGRGAGGDPARLPGRGRGDRVRPVAAPGLGDAAGRAAAARPERGGRSSYRLALQRALPRREDGSPDTAAWQALSAAAREAVRTVPEERLARIRMLRDGARLPAATPGRARGPGQRRGWLWPATLLAV